MNPARRSARRAMRKTLPVLVMFVFGMVAYAQTPQPAPPGLAPSADRPHLDPFPAEQDWSFLGDVYRRSDALDRLKYVRWGDHLQQYVSFGLESRDEYEYYGNWMFGAGAQDHDGYALIRLMPHVDLHDGPDVRIFAEMTFNYAPGRVGGARPFLDADEGDFHQGFLEVGPHSSRSLGSSLRLGRQEIVLGMGRLFDNNEGPNVKLSFDGARMITQTANLRWDNFVAKPVENNPGFLDDTPNHAQTTWGSYLTLHPSLLRKNGLDLYYLGLSTAMATYERGSANETRHTLGARVFRENDSGLRYDWESNFQCGSFDSLPIRAWSLSTETGYSFAKLRYAPRPLLRVDSYSGDHAALQSRLGTYNPYFPRGAYFTPKVVPFLGNQNLIDVHPQLQFRLRQNVTGEIGAAWYWRQSVHDGIYAFGSGIPLDRATNSHRRPLGQQGDMELRWAPADHIVVAFNVAGFSPRGYLAEVANRKPPIATNLGITYRF